MKVKHLHTPLSDEDVLGLKAGDNVLISGVIYTARDAAHKKMVELIERGEPLPIDLKGQVIYYVGPAPAKPGQAIGSAGPTTSGRMDAYTPLMLEQGMKACIGKGLRSAAVKEALEKNKGVYLAAVGGAGALLSKRIISSEVVAYPELGAEAIHRLEVKDFPATVINDAYGNDLYEEGIKAYAR
ncbi:MAG TPA: Fe-S-containing hydro-lyase [Bacillota bacterium]|jgi:fumarate hydratase subunit beta|nr:Fe-S-containing hydro-lyase [Bacillota bacterium]HOA36294.1 Fe-S-containing hydro-lyase [Bacillota bacterium]HOJ84384.1 Fe-S-containing hydro-lyase [Bacillota bacterium]HOL16392.1 Fe-S-containing hydro-lyase [Bacillota bacterium]HPZ12367.1 Fe-S-containing hydro-lyase [Bacillota bacterium]